VVLTVCFVLAIPVIFLYVLVTKRHILYKSHAIIRTIGFLYFPFQRKYFYYSYILVARSLLLSILISLLPTDSSARRLVILGVLVGFLFAQMQLRPFLHHMDNLLEAAALFCLIITYSAGLTYAGLPNAYDALVTAIIVGIVNLLFLLAMVIILLLRIRSIALSLWHAFQVHDGKSTISKIASILINQAAGSMSSPVMNISGDDTPKFAPPSTKMDSRLFQTTASATNVGIRLKEANDVVLY